MSFHILSFNFRWLSIMLELLGGMVVLFAALYAVVSRGSTTGGLVGLAITYALQVNHKNITIVSVHSISLQNLQYNYVDRHLQIFNNYYALILLWCTVGNRQALILGNEHCRSGKQCSISRKGKRILRGRPGGEYVMNFELLKSRESNVIYSVSVQKKWVIFKTLECFLNM